MQEIQVQPLGWEDPLEKEKQHTPVFFSGESGVTKRYTQQQQGQKLLADTVLREKGKTIDWERLEISSRQLEITRECSTQR